MYLKIDAEWLSEDGMYADLCTTGDESYQLLSREVATTAQMCKLLTWSSRHMVPDGGGADGADGTDGALLVVLCTTRQEVGWRKTLHAFITECSWRFEIISLTARNSCLFMLWLGSCLVDCS